jgi:hypothetical protein
MLPVPVCGTELGAEIPLMDASRMRGFTVTATSLDTDPPGPLHVIPKLVVTIRAPVLSFPETEREPLNPDVNAHAVALVLFHVRVALAP